MQKVGYYLVYPMIWSISKLPFPLLYRISDFFFLVVYYLVQYRKKLVLKNLQLVFPEKQIKELKELRRQFYRHFTDLLMEIIKTFTISSEELDEHFQYENLELLEDLKKKGRSVIVMGSHYANWEWALKFGVNIGMNGYVVYAPIKNEMFSKKIIKTRERFGIELVSKSITFKKIEENRHNNIQGLYGLVSDQSPRLSKAYYWTEFLGNRVPVLTGSEVLAKKYNMAIVFGRIEKIKRGYYKMSFEMLSEHPNEFPNYELTEHYLSICEKQIREQPQYYLWTHNRFKGMGKEHLSPSKEKLTD